jgi:hypothetical protein
MKQIIFFLFFLSTIYSNEPAIAFYEKLEGQLRKDLILVRLEQEAMHKLASH